MPPITTQLTTYSDCNDAYFSVINLRGILHVVSEGIWSVSMYCLNFDEGIGFSIESNFSFYNVNRIHNCINQNNRSQNTAKS